MTVQEIKEVFSKFNSCREWSLKLIKFGGSGHSFHCNTHNITISEPDALNEYMESISTIYLNEKGKMNCFRSVEDYDGSTDGTMIYRIDCCNPLVSDAFYVIQDAITNPDMQGDPLEFKASGYLLRGSIYDGQNMCDIQLFTIVNPFRTLKHTYFWNKESFEILPEKTLLLRQHVDLMIYKESIYLFNMNGEKLLDMERAYKKNSQERIQEIIDVGIVSDIDAFTQFAGAGFNPRRFLSFDSNRLTKVSQDSGFRDRMANKFGISRTTRGQFDSTDKENVERIVKFLCKKGMIDPVDENPVEVDGSRRWR